MPSNLNASGFTGELSAANGLWTYDSTLALGDGGWKRDEVGGEIIDGNPPGSGLPNSWVINLAPGASSYISFDNVQWPWEVTTWVEDVGNGSIPVLTEVPPAQNTHNLPQAVVDLLTANFGSVDNYLRLRNLGIV